MTESRAASLALRGDMGRVECVVLGDVGRLVGCVRDGFTRCDSDIGGGDWGRTEIFSLSGDEDVPPK